MLAASIHEHAGLGNQIWRYVCCRVFAENLEYEWGVSNPGWRAVTYTHLKLPTSDLV